MKISPLYFTKEALSSFRRNLVQSIAAITTVALCLMVVGLIIIVLFVGGELIKNIESKVEIEVFLEGPEITTASNAITKTELVEQVQLTIKSWPEVKTVLYLSKEDALEEFRETFKDSPDVLNQITDNPLPASYRISLNDPRDVDKVAQRLEELPNIQGLVGDPQTNIKYGRDTVEKLFALTRWISYAAAGFASLLIFVSLVLITNTIRLAIFARRKEIAIMRLVGASSWFVRWPFLLEGMIEGLIGAGIAVMILTVVWRTFFANLASGKVLAFMAFPFDEVAFAQLAMMLLLSGAMIGALGSVIALRRFLRV